MESLRDAGAYSGERKFIPINSKSVSNVVTLMS